MTESQATTKLLNKLKSHGFFWKASDRYRAGIPDIIGVVNGRFVAIEMKRDTGKTTALQIYTMKEIDKHAGKTFIVKYVNKNKTWLCGEEVCCDLDMLVDMILVCL